MAHDAATYFPRSNVLTRVRDDDRRGKAWLCKAVFPTKLGLGYGYRNLYTGKRMRNILLRARMRDFWHGWTSTPLEQILETPLNVCLNVVLVRACGMPTRYVRTSPPCGKRIYVRALRLNGMAQPYPI